MASKRGGKMAPDGAEQEEETSPKRNTRFVRILTVVGYIMCVSSAAVMLSLYYIFLWDPYGGDRMPSALPLVQGPASGVGQPDQLAPGAAFPASQ